MSDFGLDPTTVLAVVVIGGTMVTVGISSLKSCLKGSRKWGSASTTSVAELCVAKPKVVTVTAVEANHGPVVGRNRVTVRGTCFDDGATVTFGGVAGTNVAYGDAQSLVADVPAGTLGATDVVVTNPDGTSSLATGNGLYTYVPNRWTAKIVSHLDGRAKDAALKQYVNLPARADSDEGSKITVKVEPHDVTLGMKDQKITVVVSFPATNSLRNDPRPALIVGGHPLVSTNAVAKPGVDELVYKTQLQLPVDQGSCQFEAQLGLAGGDLCHIKVGFDDGEADDQLWLQNWRRLESEFVVPHSAIRQPWADLVNNDDDAPAPHASLLRAMKDILDPLFIEVVFPLNLAASYTAVDIAALTAARGGEQTFVLPGSSVIGLVQADRNCTFLAPTDMDALRDRVLNNAPRTTRCFSLVWSDMMAKTLSDDSVELERLDPGEYFAEFVHGAAAPQDRKTATAGLLTALRYPLCTDGSDMWGVAKVYWRIIAWRKQGQRDEDWNTDWDAGELVGEDWVCPDESHRAQWDIQEVVPASQPDVNKWVEFGTFGDFKMKCPSGPGEPGHWLQIGGIEHKISITVKLRHFKMGGNANAIHGKIRMTPTLGLGKPEGVARTLCHEMGHNLGHTYFENKGKATDRRGRHVNNKIPGVDFDLGIDNGGFFYAGKGHTGAHCAHQLKTLGLALDVKTFKAEHMVAGNCVLYGAGDQRKATPFKYCPECTRYIRASDAQDITKSWKTG